MLVIKYKLIFIFILFLISSFASAEKSQTNQLDKLFFILSESNNSDKIVSIEKKIWSIWNEHPNNQNLTDKLEFGTELMYEGSYEYALSVFTNVINSDPNWSEPWNKRATLLFLMKKYTNSLNDIKKVLKLEPRHFGALSGKAQIFIELKEYEKADIALKEAKKIHPGLKIYNLIPFLEKKIKGLEI